ncbi:MAG: hypothetical protein ACRCX2_03990 [Paraclostridium sp.]
MDILTLIYLVLGYWATGQTIYANKIIITNGVGQLFIQRFIWGTIGGWILIPIALVKVFVLKRQNN